MTPTNTEALELADSAHLGYRVGWQRRAAAELRRLAAVEYERDHLRARLDRAIAAAEEHFGEDAMRYKLSLNTRGRPTNTLPLSMDGKWFAFQRADNDAHVGLSLRCVEVEAERDALRAALKEARRIITPDMQDASGESCADWCAMVDAAMKGTQA